MTDIERIEELVDLLQLKSYCAGWLANPRDTPTLNRNMWEAQKELMQAIRELKGE